MWGTEQVDAAIDFVVRNGAENDGSTLHYSLVFEAAGLPPTSHLSPGEISRFMEQFHHRQRERRLPPLDALVVAVAGPRQGVPGAGYFRVNGLQDPLGEMGRVTDAQMTAAFDHWERERSECRRWGTEHRRQRRRRDEE